MDKLSWILNSNATIDVVSNVGILFRRVGKELCNCFLAIEGKMGVEKVDCPIFQEIGSE